VEEDLWQRHKAERGVWTEPMLMALERGMEGNKWFSLILPRKTVRGSLKKETRNGKNTKQVCAALRPRI
jgi:hypothetical protein